VISSWLQNPCLLNLDSGMSKGWGLQPGRPLPYPLSAPLSLCDHHVLTQTNKQMFSNSNNTSCPHVLTEALKRFLSANPPTHFSCISPTSAVAKLSPEQYVEDLHTLLLSCSVKQYRIEITIYNRLITVLDDGQRSNKGDGDAYYSFLISKATKNVFSLLIEGLLAHSWSIKGDSSWKAKVLGGDSNGHCEKKKFWMVIGMDSFIGHQDLLT